MVEDIQVNRFINEFFRPTCTETVKVLVRIRAILAKASADGVLSRIPNDATPINDGSEAQGFPVITGKDVHDVVSLFAELVTEADVAGSRAPALIRTARDVLP